MSSASTAEGISRTKDGVPGWDGDAATFQEYMEAAALYEQSVAYHKRSLVGPRLIAELQGSAKRLVTGQPADWVSYAGGVDRLLQFLREGLGQPRIPELTDHLLKFFKHSRRRQGESINSYVARKMEIYLRAQQAMKRLSPLHQKTTTGETRPQDWEYYRPGWWQESRYERPWWYDSWNDRSWGRSETSNAGPAQEDESEEGSTEATTGRRDSNASEGAWSSSGWTRGSTWNYTGWNTWGRDWGNGPPAVAPAGLPELMPDFVQGWLLLQDCNLDAAERNLVTTAAGGDFSLNRIIRELRAQFPDAEMKRRDAGRKQHGYLGSIPEDEDEDLREDREELSFVAEEDLNEEGLAMWASATEEAESAYAAYQQARRTLREARQKQHSVKMSRQYYKPDTGGRRDDSRIICMNCGKMGHRKANCPQSGPASSRKEPESAPFVCYAGEPELQQEPEQALGTSLPTAEAIAQGKCVVDCGATRSIGSVKALEQLMSQNIAKQGDSGVNHVDLQDKPVFNFGNSSENQCSSTVEMRLRAGAREGRLRIHALDMGQGPILLSVASLRALGAIIDFQEDLMVLRNIDSSRLIELERSASGHQLLDLSSDLYDQAHTATQEIPSLRSFVQIRASPE